MEDKEEGREREMGAPGPFGPVLSLPRSGHLRRPEKLKWVRTSEQRNAERDGLPSHGRGNCTCSLRDYCHLQKSLPGRRLDKRKIPGPASQKGQGFGFIARYFQVLFLFLWNSLCC